MQSDGKTITFPRTLWVQHGGVQVESRGDEVAVTLRDDDAFLKIFNHFGRVLKLFVAEHDSWVDTDTGQAPVAVDLSQAGHVSPVPAGTPAQSVAGSGPGAGKSGTAARVDRAKSTGAKATTRAARAKPAAVGRTARKKSPARTGGGVTRSSGTKTGAQKPRKGGAKVPVE